MTCSFMKNNRLKLGSKMKIERKVEIPMRTLRVREKVFLQDGIRFPPPPVYPMLHEKMNRMLREEIEKRNSFSIESLLIGLADNGFELKYIENNKPRIRAFIIDTCRKMNVESKISLT